MTRIRYTGISDPVKAFEELTPLVEQLRKLQMRCKPFGADYHAIGVAIEGLQTAAYHFTRRPHFWAAEDRGQGAMRS
ncbi:hypothetical protein [Phenylobacterium sp.]|jgi:hypothetical protein|uniref:hypothetical protein n=1 Tax=Phenylobacterium sp. TaxID=1871053 RepID=UPI002F95AB6D